MKPNGKTAPKRVTRRDLFSELAKGMTELEDVGSAHAEELTAAMPELAMVLAWP